MRKILFLAVHGFPIAFLLIGIHLANVPACGQDENVDAKKPPLVYTTEHSGSSYPIPEFPELSELPTVVPLTDPFMWSNGKGRVEKFVDWSRRRAEIKAELEHYEIGKKPTRPKDLSAKFEEGVLTVVVKVNGESLTLHARISLPEGKGPFPAVIGIGRGTGSLPRDIFVDRKIATISLTSQRSCRTRKDVGENQSINFTPIWNISGPTLRGRGVSAELSMAWNW